MLKRLLKHPMTRGMDLDDPATSELRKRIIDQKLFLQKIYTEWYELIAQSIASLNSGASPRILELGAGADSFVAFCHKSYPDWRVLVSDILPLKGLDLVLDACQMPLRGDSLDAVVCMDVFHHIPDPASFLREAARTLRPGGALVMLEPWNTPWSRLIYGRLHHEPFDVNTRDWSLVPGSPLTNANGALPWIVFWRDIARFRIENPQFQAPFIRPLMPFAYILSGGVSMRALLPGFLYEPVRLFERLFPLSIFAMHALIILRKTK